MWRVFIGVALVIAGIAAFIEAHSHRPEVRHVLPRLPRGQVLGYLTLTGPSRGLSQTDYDLLRIGGWALVLIGGALVVMGFSWYWRAQGQRAG
jgi:hypothetical protein